MKDEANDQSQSLVPSLSFEKRMRTTHAQFPSKFPISGFTVCWVPWGTQRKLSPSSLPEIMGHAGILLYLWLKPLLERPIRVDSVKSYGRRDSHLQKYIASKTRIMGIMGIWASHNVSWDTSSLASQNDTKLVLWVWAALRSPWEPQRGIDFVASSFSIETPDSSKHHIGATETLYAKRCILYAA